MHYLEYQTARGGEWFRLKTALSEPLPVDLIELLSSTPCGWAFRCIEPNLDWTKAKAHLAAVRSEYEELPAPGGMLALIVTFNPLQARYQSGERTEGLYNAMMNVK